MTDCGKKKLSDSLSLREPKTVYALSAAPRTAAGATLRHRGAARPRCRSWKKPEAFRQTPTTAAASTVGMWYINNNTGHVMRCACGCSVPTYLYRIIRSIVIIFVVIDVITRRLWPVIKMNSFTFDVKRIDIF